MFLVLSYGLFIFHIIWRVLLSFPSGVTRRIPRAQAGRLENSMRSTVRLVQQHTHTHTKTQTAEHWNGIQIHGIIST
jgi:hypothetical protein